MGGGKPPHSGCAPLETHRSARRRAKIFPSMALVAGMSTVTSSGVAALLMVTVTALEAVDAILRGNKCAGDSRKCGKGKYGGGKSRD